MVVYESEGRVVLDEVVGERRGLGRLRKRVWILFRLLKLGSDYDIVKI